MSRRYRKKRSREEYSFVSASGGAYPTKGIVEITGKKTPLLELGAGFHPDMTGIENIVINGVLLGHTKKDVLNRMDEIIAFSELGEFINAPLRTYSTGMVMRLAFSVAIHTDPEILLIDEILAVGDQSFQVKSSEAVKKLIRSGATTVYISHSMATVKNLCNRAIWLEKGEVKAEGETEKVIGEYLNAQV